MRYRLIKCIENFDNFEKTRSVCLGIFQYLMIPNFFIAMWPRLLKGIFWGCCMPACVMRCWISWEKGRFERTQDNFFKSHFGWGSIKITTPKLSWAPCQKITNRKKWNFFLQGNPKYPGIPGIPGLRRFDGTVSSVTLLRIFFWGKVIPLFDWPWNLSGSGKVNVGAEG